MKNAIYVIGIIIFVLAAIIWWPVYMVKMTKIYAVFMWQTFRIEFARLMGVPVGVKVSDNNNQKR